MRNYKLDLIALIIESILYRFCVCKINELEVMLGSRLCFVSHYSSSGAEVREPSVKFDKAFVVMYRKDKGDFFHLTTS